jgi:hypothetical protein
MLCDFIIEKFENSASKTGSSCALPKRAAQAIDGFA